MSAALSEAVRDAEMFLASYDAAMEDPGQNPAVVAQQDAMPLAESLRSVLAALSSPLADHVRDLVAEARGDIGDADRCIMLGVTPAAYQLHRRLRQVTNALEASVRPYGTVTDAEVEAAGLAMGGAKWRTQISPEYIRLALEGARGAH